MIPSVAECFKLMKQYRMLPNIRAHSIMVARVAGFLAVEMQTAGRDINLELTVAAALLHDIAKTVSLTTKEDHAKKGKAICIHHQFNEIAEIVAEHVVLINGVPKQCCSEKEIVYYADKRTLHDQVVSLNQRLQYILTRYGRNDDHTCRLIYENFMTCRLVETKIFTRIPYEAEQLRCKVNGNALPSLHKYV